MYTHAEITERIIAAFYSVYNTLGYGFLEKVYQNAMEVEMTVRGLAIVPQAPRSVETWRAARRQPAGVLKLNRRADAAPLANTHHFNRAQAPLNVYYSRVVVGEYFADFLVEGCVIVELKATEGIAPEHHAQLLNYLKATDINVGLLLNFGPKPEVRRKVYETARAKSVEANSET